ncbi:MULTISPECIES: TonB family protein [unclassified Nitrospina]|uniref:energy transducer TonB n=1 Tax=unclassified Nitrospina TaxID=2638683 RepID=UPI003F9A9DED
MHAEVRPLIDSINWPRAVVCSLAFHLVVISVLPLLQSDKTIPEPETKKVRMTIAEKKPVPVPPKKKAGPKPRALEPQLMKQAPTPVKTQVKPVQPMIMPPQPTTMPQTQPVSAKVVHKTPVVKPILQPQVLSQPVATQKAMIMDRTSRQRKTRQVVHPIHLETPVTNSQKTTQAAVMQTPVTTHVKPAQVQPVTPQPLFTSNENPAPVTGAQPVSHFEKYANASVAPSFSQPVQLEDWGDEGLSEEERRRILGLFARGVQQRIAGHQVYPDTARQRGVEGRTVVAFELARDGNLVQVSVAQSSGFDVLDQAAMKAIRDGSPYEAIPARLGDASLSFQLPVSFFIE